MEIKYNFQIKGNFPLFKIQSSELIDSLQKGTFYMNSLKYYREKYNKTLDETIGDPYEGKLFIHEGTLRIPGKNFLQQLKDVSLATKNENDFVMCMFGINPFFNNHFTLNDEQKEKLCGFGDSVLVITDVNEFITRVTNAAKKEDVNIKKDFVRYYKEKIDNAYQFIDLIQNGIQNIVFYKRERYSYQQEFRFTIENTTGKENKVLDIKDISDISVKIPLNDFFNSELVAIKK